MTALVPATQGAAIPVEQLGPGAKHFRALRVDGEPMDIHFIRYDRTGAFAESIAVAHEVHDGIGALTAILEDRGVEVDAPGASTTRPSTWTLLGLVGPFLRHARVPPPNYRNAFDARAKGRWPAPAIAFLTREETDAFVAHARGEKASVTAKLLSSLDKVAAAALLADGAWPRRWMVPVNLRTKGVKRYDNVVGLLFFKFEGARVASEIGEELRLRVADGQAYVPGLMGAVARFLRRPPAAERPFEHRQVTFGYLTNLGVWNASALEAHVAGGGWAIFAPVNRRSPFACALLTTGGRLAVTLSAHGALGIDSERVRKILDDALSDATGAKVKHVASEQTLARS